jgi:hypothetical protein
MKIDPWLEPELNLVLALRALSARTQFAFIGSNLISEHVTA